MDRYAKKPQRKVKNKRIASDFEHRQRGQKKKTISSYTLKLILLLVFTSGSLLVRAMMMMATAVFKVCPA